MQQSVIRAYIFAAILLVLSACDTVTPTEHVERAQRFYDNGQLNAAVIELKNALQKDPDLATARFLLGITYQTQGEYLSSLKELDHALELGHPTLEVMPALLLTKLRLGRVQEVLEALERDEPLSAQMATLKGTALIQANNLDAAKEAFRVALSQDESLAETHAGLATIAWRNGNIEEAAEHFAHAVARPNVERRIWLTKAEFEVTTGSPVAALASYQAALSTPGANDDNLVRVGIARAHIVSGDLDAAESEIDAVLTRAPNYGIAYYLKGSVAFLRGDLDAAETALRKVLAKSPNHGPTLFLMGALKYQQMQYATAEDNVVRFLRQNSRSVAGRKLLASIRLEQGNAAGALEVLRVIADDAADEQILNMAGIASMRLRDFESATNYFETAVKKSPGESDLRTRLAISLMADGREDEAPAHLENAILLDSELFRNDYLLILIRLRENKIEAAEQIARSLIERAPDNPMADNWLGLVHLANGSVEEAITAFESALAKQPSFAPAAINLARIHQSQNDLPGGKRRLIALLEHDPTNTSALMKLAELELAGGNTNDALEVLGRAPSDDPKALRARLMLAMVYLRDGQVDKAASVTEQTINVSPDDVHALAAHATILWMQNRTVEARAVIDHADAVAPKSTDARRDTELGVLLMNVGRGGRARARLNSALRIDPQTPAARVNLVKLDIREGRGTHAKENLQILRGSSIEPTILALLEGDLALLEGDLEQAVEQFTQAAAAHSRDGVLRLSETLVRQGKHGEARSVLEGWLTDQPTDVGAQLALANALLHGGMPDAAVERYESLYERIPTNPVVLNNLAWAYMERNDPRALELSERAYQLAPERADVADTYGWILLRNDRASEAVDVLERAILLDSSIASIHYHLAQAYSAVGNRAGARRSLTEALEREPFPERTEAERLLEELER